jgi:hypothetical protein
MSGPRLPCALLDDLEVAAELVEAVVPDASVVFDPR